MVAPVTKRGLLIPRRLLRGMTRVNIRSSKRGLLVTPAKSADPIATLGTKPVLCGLPDASANHDRHLSHDKA